MQCFVGSLEVIDSTESVERTLLGEEVGGRGCGGILLQSSVHALVASVLLRFAGLNEFGQDPECDPPDGELRESGDRSGGEGMAVVGANAFGQTELPEEPVEASEGGLEVEAEHALAVEQEPGVPILDGEREAELPVSGSELALEVRRPSGIGLRWDRERRSSVGPSAPWLTGLNAAVPAEDALDRVDVLTTAVPVAYGQE